MTTNVRIFFAIFAYISAIVGLTLAVLNTMVEPPRTAVGAVAACCAVVFLVIGVKLSRGSRF